MDFIYQSYLTVFQILALAFGGLMVIVGLMHLIAGKQAAMKQVLFGTLLITLTMITPSGSTNELPAVNEQFLHQMA